jgi:N-methylhydantoinase A/oxoprolinase/acetone carboxylase beta subunit
VTDAHVVLGRIDPANFLGGRLALDAERAREAVALIAQRFGMAVEEAALAILTVVNANMVREIRVHSVRRGYDPRECALVAFGGAGPLHACDIAEELEIPDILLPPAPGITSAMGLLATDLRYELVRTIAQLVADADPERLEARFAEMEDELRGRFASEATQPVLARRADCRYLGQGYELPIGLDDLGEGWRERVAASFDAQHEHEYGFSFPGHPIEIVNVRVTAVAAVEARPATSVPERAPGEALEGGTTRVLFALRDGPVEAATYERGALRAGDRLAGPAIVHEMDSTVVVSPGWHGTVAPDGTIRLERREEER